MLGEWRWKVWWGDHEVSDSRSLYCALYSDIIFFAMRLGVLLATMWTTYLPTVSMLDRNLDLVIGNRICGTYESCSGVDVDLPPSWQERNCQCDTMCKIFGDCCQDSPHFDLEEQSVQASYFSCVELRHFGRTYMRTSCPSDWIEPRTRAACENFNFEDSSDPMIGFPVTDLSTGVIYRNLFCATCHKSNNFKIWNPRSQCTGLLSKLNLTPDDVSQLLYFNRSQEKWGIDLDDRFSPCYIYPTMPDNSFNVVRPCVPDVTKSCAENWTNAEVRANCDSYTTIVYDQGGNTYKNPHCAVCNYVTSRFLRCRSSSLKVNYEKAYQSDLETSFDILSEPSNNKLKCEDGQLYDPFFKSCRKLLTGLKLSLSDRQKYNNSNGAGINPNYDVSPLKSNCTKFLIGKHSYRIHGDAVYVSDYHRWFKRSEFQVEENGKLMICVKIYREHLANKFDNYVGYITFFGLGVSVIFLLLHLTAFCIVNKLWNLPGKSMASLCVALIIAYVSFMIGRFLTGMPCSITAFITFYAFLASFFWMLTMAFDIWRALRLSTTRFRITRGKQWRKFIIYSVWSWLFPGIIVIFAAWAEFSEEFDIEWKPGFSFNYCWFGNSKPLLIFFAVPLATVMILNVIIFASCAHMIYSTTSATRAVYGHRKRNYKLYLRLAVFMGLNWLFGLGAGIFKNYLFWDLFILINTLQGFFIFISFTWTVKVKRSLGISKKTTPCVTPFIFLWFANLIIRRSQTKIV